MHHDEAALNAALDLNPSDAETRLILADFYEENGREKDAARERWLVATGRWPCKSEEDVSRWDWFRKIHMNPDEQKPEHVVPDTVFYELSHFGEYSTRRAAEDDLWRNRGAFDEAVEMERA